MASSPTPEAVETMRVGPAVSAYLTSLPPAESAAQGAALSRFVEWCGDDRDLNSLLPSELERYQSQLADVGTPTKSLESLRAFFTEARKRRWTATNMGVHIKVRRKPSALRGGMAEPEQRVEMTQTGREALQRELERLEKEVRPQLTDALQKAAADKDFRENAPYDAAKRQLAEVQTRINVLRSQIGHAEIVEVGNTDRAGLGTRVVLHDLVEDEELTYTLVGPGEIDARRGRISVQSPVGRALVDHVVGDTVEVQTPAGSMHYRIERIEAPD